MRPKGLDSREVTLSNARGDETTDVNLLSYRKALEMKSHFESMIPDGVKIPGIGYCYGKLTVGWWPAHTTTTNHAVFYVVDKCPHDSDALIRTSSRDSSSSSGSEFAAPLGISRQNPSTYLRLHFDLDVETNKADRVFWQNKELNRPGSMRKSQDDVKLNSGKLTNGSNVSIGNVSRVKARARTKIASRAAAGTLDRLTYELRIPYFSSFLHAFKISNSYGLPGYFSCMMCGSKRP